MRILVTGATGFIGKNLIKSLKSIYTIYIVTKEKKNLPEISPENEFVFNDNIDDLVQFIQKNKIEGIIHLATKYVAEHDSSDIKDLIYSNLYFSTAILESAALSGIKWFLNIGTIWQNYNSKDFLDTYNPVNLYAATKQAFITLAKFYQETTSIRFCTLKLCDTFGPNDNRKKIIDLLDEFSKSGEPLVMSKGEQLLDIVHVDKVIEGIKKLIEILSNPEISYEQEYVVSSGKHISLRNLVKEYEEKNHVIINIKWGGRPYRTREVMKPYIGKNILPTDENLLINNQINI